MLKVPQPLRMSQASTATSTRRPLKNLTSPIQPRGEFLLPASLASKCTPVCQPISQFHHVLCARRFFPHARFHPTRMILAQVCRFLALTCPMREALAEQKDG